MNLPTTPTPHLNLQESESLSDTDLMLIHADFVTRVRTKMTKEETNISKLTMNTGNKNKEFARLMSYSHESISTQNKIEYTKHLECTHRCDMYESSIASNVFVCKDTGNIHYCTQGSCNALETTNENRFCLITGATYKLDTWVILQHNDMCDYSNRERITETEASLRKKQTKVNNELDKMEGLSRKKPQKPKHPKRTVTDNTKQAKELVLIGITTPVAKTNTILIEPLLCVAKKFIGVLTPSLNCIENSRLAELCLKHWILITQTKYYEKIKGRYKFLAHCAAMLYLCMQGVKISGVYVLQREEILYSILPPTKMIESFGVKKNAYTSASRYFKESIRESFMNKKHLK